MSRSDRAGRSGETSATEEGPRAGSQSGQEADSTADGPNEWTLMIYHSGQTDLSEEFVWALKEIARVGTPDKVEVVALMDSVSPDLWMFTVPRNTAGAAGVTVDDKQASRAEVGLFNNEVLSPERVPRKEWEEWGQAHSATRETRAGHPPAEPNLASAPMLFNFVIHCIRKHRARRYMLILSGHGAGMIGETLLIDQGSGRYMSVPMLSWALDEIVKEIGNLLKEGKQEADPRVDVVGFDACGMLAVEVAALLRKRAKYIVGSEDIMHRAGWPYHLILEYLIEKNDAEPEELARETVRRCMGFYSDFARVGLSIEMAAVGVKKTDSGGEKEYEIWDKLLAALKSLTQRLSDGIKAPSGGSETREAPGADVAPHIRVRNAVIVAHWYAQSYGVEQYADLRDFCEQLKKAAPEFAEECDAVIGGLAKVVIKSRHSGAAVQHSHGLSIFFPWVATDAELDRYSYYRPRDSDDLESTPFNRDTGWGDFLREFIYATRREVREGEGELIFMPPPGYRDHLRDHHATSGIKSPVEFAVPPAPERRTPPDPRRTPPDPRSSAGGMTAFAKIKNPALAFYERGSDDDKQKNPGK